MKSLTPALLLALGLASTRPAAAQVDQPHETVKLADGVYALVWATAGSEPNSLIVIGDDGVVVVDSSLLPSTAEMVIAEVKKLTRQPVRFVVNTHWHGDHIFGNGTYRAAWPDVHFIAHPYTRIDGLEQGFTPIPTYLAQNKKQWDTYQKLLESGTNSAGKPLTDAQRTRLKDHLLPFFARYQAEVATVATVLPDLTVTDRLTLHSGSKTIEVRYLGRGNTRGDLVVLLPNERIVATGDLVVHPTPFGIGSYYAEWADTLKALTELGADTYVVGHGAIQRDTKYITQLRELFAATVSRVKAEVAKGASLEDVKKTVTLEDWKKTLAGDDVGAQRSFDAFYVTPAVERAYRQAKGEPDSQKVS